MDLNDEVFLRTNNQYKLQSYFLLKSQYYYNNRCSIFILMKKENKVNKTQPQEVKNNKQNSSLNSPKGLKKQDKFLEQNSPSEKQKLIEQNIRLKTQIFDLSRQLDEIMAGQEQKRKKNGAKHQEQDETTKAKKMQLKRQQLQVANLKNKINAIKKQLETVYNNRSLVARQDELKVLKFQLENLQQQKKNLLRIKNDQTKVLKIVKNQQQFEQKIDQLKKQLQAARQQSKVLNQKILQSERTLRKNHENYIVKQKKLKQLQTTQNQGNHSQSKQKNKNSIQGGVTNQMIEELQQEIANLQQQRRDNEKSWHQKINLIDSQLKEKKLEEEKKLMLLKQKEKELKLSEIKIKELKKLIKSSVNENQKTSMVQDVDMHQFRHRRNIKYMKQ